MTDEALHAAIGAGERPAPPGRLSTALTFGWRGILKVKHVPEQLLDATLTPVLFLLMFTYLFGGAVAGSTTDYLQYILPGVLVQSVLFTAVYSGVSLNTDVTKGVTDRFRSLPIWRPAPLVGAVLGDSVRFAMAAVITAVLGVVLGFRAGAGAGGIVLAILLVLVFTFALSWVFPLSFLSNTFVDPDTLPGWLEWFVRANPVSHLTTASRHLMAGTTDWDGLLLVLGEAAVLLAVFLPLTVRRYRRA
jgi:ABC-2 type transport system permease protein